MDTLAACLFRNEDCCIYSSNEDELTQHVVYLLSLVTWEL